MMGTNDDPALPTETMVAQGTRDPADERTHIERINGVGNPADGPVTEAPPAVADDPADKPRPYRLLAKEFRDGMLRLAGSIVMLLPHEVAAHHEPMPEPMPEPEPHETAPEGME